MAIKPIVRLPVDCASNPLPADAELLVQIASQTEHTYADAYTVWQAYHQYPDVYLIIDTVLWIARIQELSVKDALNVVQSIIDQFGGQTD